MTRFYLLVEGQTEETFVRELLDPHYARRGMFISPIILSTSPGHRGGVTSYGKVKRQITRLCRQDRAAFVSMLIDLYALPSDFPGKDDPAYPARGTGRQKAEFIEAQLMLDINEPNFLPNILVHEFEALLFVDPGQFLEWTETPLVADALNAVAQAHATPEDINDHPLTAPSKRILKLMPGYQKTFHGPLIATQIGLDRIREGCPHFDAWLLRMEAVVASDSV